MDTTYEQWLECAERDIESAKFLCKMYPAPLEIICYHCQQSAEKILKALLVADAFEPPRTHDLGMLYNLCSQYADISSIATLCDKLNIYATTTRYPTILDINEHDMRRAVESAERIMEFVKNLHTRGRENC